MLLTSSRFPLSVSVRLALFRRQMLGEAIECNDGLSASELAKRVLCAVDEFVGSAKHHDDMTLMVMRLIEAQ